MACYRNASMLMHAALSAADAARALAAGRVSEAAALLFRRSVAQSIWALRDELRPHFRVGIIRQADAHNRSCDIAAGVSLNVGALRQRSARRSPTSLSRVLSTAIKVSRL